MEHWLLILILFFHNGTPQDVVHISTHLSKSSCVAAMSKAKEMKAPKGSWFACVPSKIAAPTLLKGLA